MNLQSAWRHFLSVCLGAVVASGCGGATKANEGPTNTCQFAIDCEKGDVCTNGMCVTPKAGSTDAGPPDAGPVDAGPPVPVTVALTGCPFIGFQTQVTVGDQTFEMSVDTGSTSTAVATTACSNCGVTPEYSLDDGGMDTGTTASSQYGSGSWNAEVYTDSVQVGGEMPAVNMVFGGMTSQSMFFIDGDCTGGRAPSASQGILGMGPLGLSAIMMNDPVPADAYFNDLVQTANIPNVFSIELCSMGGNMWFGGYDPSAASGPALYTPMVMISQAPYYMVGISSMALGGTDLNASDPYSVVDTGTSLFYMPSAAYSALTNEFASTTSTTGMAATTVFGAGQATANFFNQGGCLAAASGMAQSDVDAMLPPLVMTMPGMNGGSPITLTLPATQSYLVPVTSGGQTCYVSGVNNNNQIGGTIIGATALRTNITVFDSGNGQVGFVPQTQCQ